MSQRILSKRILANRTLQVTSLLGVSLLVVFCVALSAQDAPPVPDNAVVQGTVVLIQLTDRLDTRSVKAGDHFHARLAEPLTASNGLTVDAGRKIKGHVSAVQPGMHTRLLLSFDEIETAHGWMPLIATVTGVPGEHGLKQMEKRAKS